MDSFYLFLPSNVSDITERNTIANYVTHLPQTMKLYGSWEVGISEILYTKTWFNIVEDEEVRLITEYKGISTQSCPIPAGCYRDLTSVMIKLNECLNKLISQFRVTKADGETVSPVIRYTRDKQRIVMLPGKLQKNMIIPLLPQSLRAILGFDLYNDFDFDEETEIDGKLIKGACIVQRVVDISATIHAIYVYCDIVKSSVVGDSFSKLLRVVSVPNAGFGETIQKIYDQPQFFPLEKKEFQTIEIDIKDDTGTTLKFDSGRVIIVLHFRKRE